MDGVAGLSCARGGREVTSPAVTSSAMTSPLTSRLVRRRRRARLQASSSLRSVWTHGIVKNVTDFGISKTFVKNVFCTWNRMLLRHCHPAYTNTLACLNTRTIWFRHYRTQGMGRRLLSAVDQTSPAGAALRRLRRRSGVLHAGGGTAAMPGSAAAGGQLGAGAQSIAPVHRRRPRSIDVAGNTEAPMHVCMYVIFIRCYRRTSNNKHTKAKSEWHPIQSRTTKHYFTWQSYANNGKGNISYEQRRNIPFVSVSVFVSGQ